LRRIKLCETTKEEEKEEEEKKGKTNMLDECCFS